ncbi:MAG: acetyl-CoA carboxylase biotin carboxyl carrier protein subunit [Flavobacteriales bacterium]|nr:acetyl-CoA carboxylase biotin carboxyl carrier protein subunit [Flavobacteriales bacterium]
MANTIKILAEGREFMIEPGPSPTVNGQFIEFSMIKEGQGYFHVLKNNISYRVEVLKTDVAEKKVTLRINGKTLTLQVQDAFDQLLNQMGLESMNARKVNDLKSPMPGLIIDIPVQEGQAVSAGEPLIVLEAMKMENILKAPADVTIKKVLVQKGKAVEKNEVLIQFG